jgi:polar amino acid transport system permease protein
VFILVFALVLAVMRGLPGPALFPLRALAVVYADFFRGVPTILVIAVLGFGAPALDLKHVPALDDVLGDRRARTRLHRVRLGGVPGERTRP